MRRQTLFNATNKVGKMFLHLRRQQTLPTFLVFFLCGSSFAAERNLPEELKAMVSICTSGFSASSKGKLEAGLVRFLSNQIEATGELDISAGGAEDLLKQFEDQSLKLEALKVLNSCVKDVVGKVYDFRTKQNIPRSQQSDKILVPETLNNVDPGQKFALAIGQSTSLADGRATIAVTGLGGNGIVPRVTLSEGSDVRRYAQPDVGDNISFKDKSCWVTYYATDPDKKAYSFQLQCKK